VSTPLSQMFHSRVLLSGPTTHFELRKDRTEASNRIASCSGGSFDLAFESSTISTRKPSTGIGAGPGVGPGGTGGFGPGGTGGMSPTVKLNRARSTRILLVSSQNAVSTT